MKGSSVPSMGFVKGKSKVRVAADRAAPRLPATSVTPIHTSHLELHITPTLSLTLIPEEDDAPEVGSEPQAREVVGLVLADDDGVGDRQETDHGGRAEEGEDGALVHPRPVLLVLLTQLLQLLGSGFRGQESGWG